MATGETPYRVVLLKRWMQDKNLEQQEIAEQVGISPQLLSMTLMGKRVTQERLDKLLTFGIPQEFLPKPRKKKKRGPKGKKMPCGVPGA